MGKSSDVDLENTEAIEEERKDGTQLPNMEESDSDPRKRGRVEETEEKEFIASMPPPKQNRTSSVNVEAGMNACLYSCFAFKIQGIWTSYPCLKMLVHHICSSITYVMSANVSTSNLCIINLSGHAEGAMDDDLANIYVEACER